MLWRISRFENDAAVLEAVVAEAPEGAPSGPITTADPLGETPLTFEILSEA